MVRIALSLLAAFFLSGCFVIDEIQKGNDLIERHSAGWRKEKEQRMEKEKKEAEEAAASSGSPLPGWSETKGKAQKWWQAALKEEAAPMDPNNTVTSCEIGGQVQFLRKSDCALRGGRTKARTTTP